MQSALRVLLLVVSASVCAMSASNFGYSVSDPLTGDNKDQQEVRVGGSVMGYYRLADADGLIRTVNYQADPINGFTAQVDRSPAVVAAPAVIAPSATIAAPTIPIGRAMPLAPQLISPTSNIGFQQKYNFQTLGALPAGWTSPYLRK